MLPLSFRVYWRRTPLKTSSMAASTYPELDQMLEDMHAQNELYKPSIFWAEAASRIKTALCSQGVERFRSLPDALGFFVPTYGSPGNSLTAEQSRSIVECLEKGWPGAKKSHLTLRQFLSGEMAALADYRVLLAADAKDRTPHIHGFSESMVGQPIEQFEFDGRRFSRSSLNYLLGVALLKKHLDAEEPRVVLEIGGGFGTLGEILAGAGISNLRYIDVDIPPLSFVAHYYLSEVLGSGNMTPYSQTRTQSSIEITALAPASVLCPWQIEKLLGQVDLFVNFISFQEMEPPIVRNYLQHVSRLGTRWVLLRNLREGKQLRQSGGWAGVDEPIFGDDYIAMLPGYELVDRTVLPFGYRTVDHFHSELLLLQRKS